MKTILITIALLIGLSITGQDSIPRISEITYDYYSNSDNNYTMEYHYDSEDKLEFVYRKDYEGDTDYTYFYNNDTLYKSSRFAYKYYHYYTSDSVITTDVNGSIHWIFDIDENKQWLDNGYYTWYNGNCVEGGNDWYATFQTNFRNPLIHTNLHFKAGWVVFYGNSYNLLKVMFNSSYNIMDTHYESDGNIRSLVVTDSIGEWPTKIEYWINDIFRGIWYIEYHDWILSSTPEISIDPHTVLQTDYYDMIGRSIEKPTQGFYIERKTTEKGIISKKYFIK